MSKKRLTIQKKDAGIQAYSEKHLKNYLQAHQYEMITRKISGEIEKNTQSRLRVVKELMNDANEEAEGFKAVANFLDDVDKGVYGTTSTSGKKSDVRSTASVRDAFNRVKRDITGLTSSNDDRSLSHVGISNLSIHLYAFYVELRAFGTNFNWKAQTTTQRGGGPSGFIDEVPMIDEYDEVRGIESKPVLTKVRTYNQTQFTAFTERIRQLYFMAKAVAEMPISKFTGDKVADMQTALTDYFAKGNDKILADKKQVVDVATGKAELELIFEEQDLRSEVENLIGTSKAKELLGRKKVADIEFIRKHFANDFSQIVGSPSIKEDVIKGLSEQLVTGKKPKTRKHSSKYTNTKKRKKPAAAQRVEKNIKDTLKAAAVAGAAFKGIRDVGKSKAPGQKPQRKADGEALTPKQLGYLRRKINTRLPQQVAENMGRPALIFQTGRFANSTRLVDLKQGDKNLVGKYTYMLNPYETFENTGRYRWPTGYNPKPLIAQSIRELAEQYTNKKFTLRRQ
jgi:hypothetical protein